jgi:hypothetical protein
MNIQDLSHDDIERLIFEMDISKLQNYIEKRQSRLNEKFIIVEKEKYMNEYLVLDLAKRVLKYLEEEK